MRRILMALALITGSGAAVAGTQYAVYKLSESEAFDFRGNGYQGGAWENSRDKKQAGLLLIQYATTTPEGVFVTKGMQSPTLELIAGSRFYLWQIGRERYFWAMDLGDTYRLTNVGSGTAALTHIAGDTKSNLDESESMILIGNMSGDEIKSFKGTQLRVDEGWQIGREDFKLRRHKNLSEVAAAAAAQGGYEAAMNAVAESLENEGYMWDK